jgi:hypothetical protein
METDFLDCVTLQHSMRNYRFGGTSYVHLQPNQLIKVAIYSDTLIIFLSELQNVTKEMTIIFIITAAKILNLICSDYFDIERNEECGVLGSNTV